MKIYTIGEKELTKEQVENIQNENNEEDVVNPLCDICKELCEEKGGTFYEVEDFYICGECKEEIDEIDTEEE